MRKHVPLASCVVPFFPSLVPPMRGFALSVSLSPFLPAFILLFSFRTSHFTRRDRPKNFASFDPDRSRFPFSSFYKHLPSSPIFLRVEENDPFSFSSVYPRRILDDQISVKILALLD